MATLTRSACNALLSRAAAGLVGSAMDLTNNDIMIDSPLVWIRSPADARVSTWGVLSGLDT
jgi:hypothetical protein